MSRTSARAAALVAAATTLTVTAACSVVGGGEEETATEDRVVLVTHDSFALPDELVADFEADTGLSLEQRASGDAGALTNRLVLTKDSPTGDVAFGVDNTFASRAVSEDVFEAYAADLPEGAEEHVLESAGDHLTPVDTAHVCLNVDTRWFARHDQEPPRGFEDLTRPEHRGQLVVPGASTSSPGLAFLLATIDEYGEEWADYWSRLMANDTLVVGGWSDAYQVDFTGGGGDGDRPVVVSYDTSPAFTLTEDGSRTTTRALLDTCYRQVEYAGVLAGAENPDGAREVVDWLLSDAVQAALPESMYVFPVSDRVDLPEDWERFTERPEDPHLLDPDRVDEQRRAWLTEWTDITTR